MIKVNFELNDRKITVNYYTFDIFPPASAKPIREFYDIWNKCRGDNRLPSRKDMKFEYMKGWHSNIKLTYMGLTPQDKKKNLILGEKYQQYWGRKTMKQQIEEMGKAGIPFMKKYHECLQHLYDGHYGINTGLCPNSDGSMRNMIWIDLPLAENSENMDHIITAIVPLP